MRGRPGWIIGHPLPLETSRLIFETSDIVLPFPPDRRDSHHLLDICGSNGLGLIARIRITASARPARIVQAVMASAPSRRGRGLHRRSGRLEGEHHVRPVRSFRRWGHRTPHALHLRSSSPPRSAPSRRKFGFCFGSPFRQPRNVLARCDPASFSQICAFSTRNSPILGAGGEEIEGKGDYVLWFPWNGMPVEIEARYSSDSSLTLCSLISPLPSRRGRGWLPGWPRLVAARPPIEKVHGLLRAHGGCVPLVADTRRACFACSLPPPSPASPSPARARPARRGRIARQRHPTIAALQLPC